MRKQPLHPLTAVINKKQQALSKQMRQSALNWLAATFPAAFNDSASIHPLKINIIKDILEHKEKALEAGISITKIREAVRTFTSKIDYLTCIKAREMRIDLAGKPTQNVTEEEALQAAAKIRKIIERNAKLSRQSNEAISLSPSLPNLSSPSSLELVDDSNDGLVKPQSANVIIQHKTKKAIDPNAVARLKEKLGLKEPA